MRVEDGHRDHRSDPLPGDPAQADRFAGDRDAAGVGPDEPDEDPEGRRLAGAIGAEQPDHVALVDGQIEPVEGGHSPISFS